MVIEFESIGVIHTPFKVLKDTPIQPRFGRGTEGIVELLPEYEAGLADLEGFSHLMLLYYFHRSDLYSLKVRPFLDDQLRGVFATRAPRRPNGIGISVVRLVTVDGLSLRIRDLDIVDGTPLLDIKPYVPEFGPGEDIRIGWLKDKIL